MQTVPSSAGLPQSSSPAANGRKGESRRPERGGRARNGGEGALKTLMDSGAAA
jgi:hypothetical protein